MNNSMIYALATMASVCFLSSIVVLSGGRNHGRS